MSKTTNYNLNKPEGNDYININDLNENADIIDGAIKDVDEETEQVEQDLATHVAEKVTQSNAPHGLKKNKYDATLEPTKENDVLEGFGVGSVWIMDNGTDKLASFICLENEKDKAIWTEYAQDVTKYADDKTNAPGAKMLIAGSMQSGFFGEVDTGKLLGGSQLSSELGISSGTIQHSSEPYLKFAFEGRIQFVAKKTFRNGLSWSQINSVDAVFGKVITIAGLNYKVRLLKGGLTDPSNYSAADRGAIGSEWNKLMLPIHEKSIDESWSYPAYVESDIPVWNHGLGSGVNGMYTDSDLLTSGSLGEGSFSWCQEMPNGNADRRIYRGRHDASFSESISSESVTTSLGWRPVLELIE